MSTGRLKDQKDFDLEQIVKIIDTALESDDQRIKDALRALMTVTVLCTAEHPDQAFKGPLARVLEDMHNLARRLSSLEDDMRKIQWDQQKKQVEPYMPTNPTPRPTPFGPTPTTGSPWVYPNDPTKPTPMWGPSWTSTEVGDLPDLKKWTAGDDPAYKGSSASGMLAGDFIKSLEENK
jgi:hypothetical protein